MFGKIVIVNNEIDENKGTPESQAFKKKKKKKLIVSNTLIILSLLNEIKPKALNLSTLFIFNYKI
jgi:hypothetical protein